MVLSCDLVCFNSLARGLRIVSKLDTESIENKFYALYDDFLNECFPLPSHLSTSVFGALDIPYPSSRHIGL